MRNTSTVLVIVIGVGLLSILSCNSASTPEAIYGTSTSIPLTSPSSTSECETHTASLTLSAPRTTLAVGESVTVTATLRNQGCGMLGLLKYTLNVHSEPFSDGEMDKPPTGTPVSDPEYTPQAGNTPFPELSVLERLDPGSVEHYLAVDPGESDRAEFVLKAVEVGEAYLTASVSYEVHLGYPGPAYWGHSSTGEALVIVVRDE